MLVDKSLEQMMEEIGFTQWVKYDLITLDPDQFEVGDISSDELLEDNELDRYIKRLLRECDPSYKSGLQFEDKFATISLALENAYVHAHNFERRELSLKVFSGEKGNVVRLRDSGKGFDWKNTVEQLRSGSRYFQNLGSGFEVFDKSPYEVSFEGRGNTINMMIAQTESILRSSAAANPSTQF